MSELQVFRHPLCICLGYGLQNIPGRLVPPGWVVYRAVLGRNSEIGWECACLFLYFIEAHPPGFFSLRRHPYSVLRWVYLWIWFLCYSYLGCSLPASGKDEAREVKALNMLGMPITRTVLCYVGMSR